MRRSGYGPASAFAGVAAIALSLLAGPAWGAAEGAHDPAGNNGTLKVDTYPPGSGMDNDPHVGCSFALRFFGFDQDQHADITFVAQAPSGSGQVVHTDHNVLISDDPAAGGPNDEDATIPYHVLGTTGPGAAIDLSGLTAGNQGYHLKVMSNSVEAPGGAKQKVFWVDCAPPAAAPVSGPSLSAPVETSSESMQRSLLETGSSSVEGNAASPSPGVVVAVPVPQPAVANVPGSNVRGERFARSTAGTGGSEQALASTGAAVAAVAALGALLIAAGLTLGRAAKAS